MPVMVATPPVNGGRTMPRPFLRPRDRQERVRFSLELTPEEHKTARLLARYYGISLQDLLGGAIAERLNQETRELGDKLKLLPNR